MTKATVGAKPEKQRMLAGPSAVGDIAETFKATVAEAVAEQEEIRQREAGDQPRRKRVEGMTILMILAIAAFVASFIYAYTEMKALSQPLDANPEQSVRAMALHLRSVVSKIEAYKAEHAIYPAALSQVGVAHDESLKYRPLSGEGYLLEYSRGVYRLTFDSRTGAIISSGP